MRTAFFTLLLLVLTTSSAFAANPVVRLQITGAVTGTIDIELYPDKTPVTVANFVSYVKAGFYNNLIFHRVVNSGFYIVQGGGFDTNFIQKTAGLLPPILNESSNRLSNTRGTIAMARTEAADSATSQFYFNVQNNDGFNYGTLDNVWVYNPNGNYLYQHKFTQVGYCVFGTVVAGMGVVDLIAAYPTTDDVPNDNIIIQSATIITPGPACAQFPKGDINFDCRVNFKDFALLSANWAMCNSLITPCSW
ncbi:MAG: hypothetical protein A2Y07_07915 [Planctomycetes bacterium GWF2_50_10]|nr:MAG: hypothetical protein A2Y07_07915 [Planctomycetes bacterium GWF2_50_10]